MRVQARRVEADLQRILTHLLQADVPGSGVTPDDVRTLVRVLLLGGPGAFVLLWLLRVCCSRRRPTRAAAPASSGSRGSRSRAGKASKRSSSKQ